MTVVLRHFEALGAYRIGRSDQDPAGPRVLLVGEDNPASPDPRSALWPSPRGSAGGRLQARILGLSPDSYFGLWRTNLCVGRWDAAAARAVARLLLPRAATVSPPPWVVAVLLGRKVAAAFETTLDYPLPPWSTHRHAAAAAADGAERDVVVDLVCIPHPSGLARDWNDPASAPRARAMVAAAAPWVPWGELGGSRGVVG